MKSKITALFFTALAVFILMYLGTGCELPQAKKGLLKLNLTDAPANYEEVFITFNQISVHYEVGIDNATDNATDNSTDNDTDTGTDNATGKEGWIVISNEEQGFDLLQLQEGKVDLLAQASLDAGKYTQIRLKITDATDNNSEPKTYVKVDGVKYPLVVPSGTKSGLKLTHPFTITGDNETVLYLDFDATKSVNQTGSGKYNLKPTIKVLTEPPKGK
ncbi:MAG: DUF4382 domain-containing protein [Pseudomonadota bacterium]|jgi:hypothetical protein